MVRKSIVHKMTIIAMIFIIATYLIIPVAVANADRTDIYSNVIDDLKKDSNFDASAYRMNVLDYSLHLIQVAESVDNEVFVYLYQPSGQIVNLTASSINISTTSYLEPDYKNYKLELVSSSGVFFKYLVKDITVSSAPVRYYTITSVYRPFDASYDKGYPDFVTEVNFDVSKQFCFGQLNNEYVCSVSDIETITVTDKFVGLVRYFGGYHLFGSGSCDSHFVAFNTDKDIDRLYEADVYYTSQNYHLSDNNSLVDWLFPDQLDFYDIEEHYANLTYTQKNDFVGSGWGHPTYSWDRIQTVDQFLEENTSYKNVYSGAILDVNVSNYITDEGKKSLEGKKWVLRFAETFYSESSLSTTGRDIIATVVGNVTILRLKFESDGQMYNLGVIDNKQSGSNDPINGSTTDIDVVFNVFDWLAEKTGIPRWAWIMIAIAIPLAIILPVLSIFFPAFRAVLTAVFKGISTAIVWLLKGLVFLICLPFRGIKALIEKIKNR